MVVAVDRKQHPARQACTPAKTSGINKADKERCVVATAMQAAMTRPCGHMGIAALGVQGDGAQYGASLHNDRQPNRALCPPGRAAHVVRRSPG